MYSHTSQYELLYNNVPIPNVATFGAALSESTKPFIEKLEQIETQLKPFRVALNKAHLYFKPLLDKLKASSKHFVKFIKFARHKVKQGFLALSPKTLLIARRYKSPPRIYTDKHYRVLVPQLIVLSSVITPNAPN